MSNKKLKDNFKYYSSISQLDLSIYKKITLSYLHFVDNHHKHSTDLRINKLSRLLGISSSTMGTKTGIIQSLKDLGYINDDLTPTNKVIVNENKYYRLFYYILQLNLKPTTKLILTCIISFDIDKKPFKGTDFFIKTEMDITIKSVIRGLTFLDDENIIKRIRIGKTYVVGYGYPRRIELNKVGISDYKNKVVSVVRKKKKVQEKAPIEVIDKVITQPKKKFDTNEFVLKMQALDKEYKDKLTKIN